MVVSWLGHNPSDPAPCYPNTPQLMTAVKCSQYTALGNLITLFYYFGSTKKDLKTEVKFV